jgi:flagellar biosynthesis/type III secretory pathway chaperone
MIDMTADLSTDLIHILCEELDAYRCLADLLGRQRQFIVQRGIEEMRQSTAEEESLIRQTEQLGEDRTSAVLALAQGLGIQSNSVTLSDLFPLLDEDTASELVRLREDLANIVKTINDLTKTNKFLITHALRMAAKGLAILEGIDDGDIVYAQTGRRDPSDQTTLNVINRKI